MGSARSTGSAEIQKDLIEMTLCEKFGWLPEQIARLPYRWIQKFFIIENAKNAGLDMKSQIEKFKDEQKQNSRPGTRKFYREI